MDRDQLWISMSYAWADTNLSDEEINLEAKKLKVGDGEILVVIFIVYFSIIPSFAVSSFMAFISGGLALPPSGYESNYILESHRNLWYRRYIYLNLINPLFWVGMPISYFLGHMFFRRLIREINYE